MEIYGENNWSFKKWAKPYFTGIHKGEVPEDVKKFLEAAEKMNVKDVIKSETANILTTEHKVVLLSEFDLEDIFYVDDDGNIKDR